MSQPFRVRVPSSTSAQHRGGRSLADIEERNKKDRQQRGYRRGGRRNNYKKEIAPKPQPPRLKPGQKGYSPVGGGEWYNSNKNDNLPTKIRADPIMINILKNMTPDQLAEYSKFIPRHPTHRVRDQNAQNPTEVAISNGWEIHEESIQDEHGNTVRCEVYWTHPKYVPMAYGKIKKEPEPHFRSGYVTWYGNRYEVPIATGNDPLGLAYVFDEGKSGYSQLVSNNWRSFWDDRSGKRRANYLDYLDYRKKRRAHFARSLPMGPAY